LMATRPRGLLGLTLAVVLGLVAAACSNPTAHQGPTHAGGDTFPVSLTDDDGTTVTVRSAPQRIVTFAPSDTEIVYALGLGSRLVGVSGPADDYPSAAKQVARVGAGEFGTEP